MKEQLRFDGVRGLVVLFLVFYGGISFVYDWIPDLDGTLPPHDRFRPLIVAAAVVSLIGFQRWRSSRGREEGTPA